MITVFPGVCAGREIISARVEDVITVITILFTGLELASAFIVQVD